MDEKTLQRILFSYFAGTATVSQKLQIEIWLSTHPQNQEIFFQYLELWERQDPHDKSYVGKDFEKLMDRIQSLEDLSLFNPEPLKKNGTMIISLKTWKHLVAGLLLAILGSVTFLLFYNNLKTTYITGENESKMIILPDGSSVQLNHDSQITFYNDWNKEKPREIWVTGEGFFSVVHTRHHQKFIVHSEDMKIEVLGTQFNVNQRLGSTKVVLTEGKIMLNFDAAERVDLIMDPGDMVRYTAGTSLTERKKVNPELYTAWRTNELVFEHTPVKDVIQFLELNYDLKIIIPNQNLKDEIFTATLPADDPEVLVSALSKAFGLEVIREKQMIKLLDPG